MSRNRDRMHRAYTAGVLEADGGENIRDQFTGAELASYDRGKAAHIAEMEASHAYDNHPLRLLSRRAWKLRDETDTEEVRDLCTLLDEVMDYILDKEESR